MSPFTFSALAGILCLPATYGLSREGSISLAVLVVALLGAIGGGIAQWRETNSFRPWFLLFAFVVGAALSEAVAFVYYYVRYGYHDPKLSVGVSVSIIEFFVISVVGGLALAAAAFITRSRITRRSRGRSASGAPLS